MNITIQPQPLHYNACSGCKKPSFTGALKVGQKLTLNVLKGNPSADVLVLKDPRENGIKIVDKAGKCLQKQYFTHDNHLWAVEDYVNGVKDKIMTIYVSGKNKGKLDSVRGIENGILGDIMKVKEDGTIGTNLSNMAAKILNIR